MNKSIEDLQKLIEDQEFISSNTNTKYQTGQKLYLEVEVQDPVAATGLNYWRYGNDGELAPLGLKLNKINFNRTDLTRQQLEKIRDVIDDVIYNDDLK